MELNRAESAAVAAVGGVPADVLDAGGRLVVSPNPLSVEGRRNVPADLLPGESLAAFLGRHVPGIECGAWTVSISGYDIPQSMWARTFPKHGQLIACRALPARSALQLVALAALTYFSGGIAAGIYGAAGGTYVAAAAGTWISAIQAGVFIAGSVLINKVLGPKIPSAQSLAQKQIYSLSDQRNTARPYEPIPVLWGEMRVTPDLASKSYAWYEGDDQYLSTILLGGINVHSVADLAIGDTPIGNYSDVSVYYNGFPGMPSQDVPLYSNVDAIAGAEFVNGGDWITRTGSAGAGVLQLDIEGQLYDVGGKGNINANWVDLTIQARLVGAPAWTTLSSSTLTNASTDVLRRTFSFDVAPGQYEVRAKLGVPRWNDGGSGDACKFSWVSLKSVQADATDYSQWGRIGIKIRASGQLSGSLDQVRATYRAKPMPIWTGSGWATATTRADGLSNPGAILLQTLRGVWATDSQGQRVLQFGFGLSDEQIDIEGLKAFMLHCAARGYTYDKWITPSMSLGAFCEEVALAGMGEFAWTDGSRPTAVFVTSGQPNSAVVNMANMLKGGFSVDYALSNAADGIEYQWLNRDTWEMTTLRVMAPGVTTMLSPARVTGEGITSEQHAAVMARYHLAQSLYQYKTVHYTADIEHLDYRRLSVLSVSHDLTQWGFGGRVMEAKRIGAQLQLTLDEPVPALASAYIGLRVPGARDYRVWPVQPLAAESDVVTLVGEWPADLDFPGEGIGNPAHDTLWCYDFKATPGYRVRVTGIDPESDLKGARITAVPEGPEFWDYVFNGTYVPAPNQSSIPQLGRPVVKNLRVSEKVNLQGDTEWYELSCVWDVEGECDHAQVWAGRDGSELRMVDGNAQGARSTFRIDGAGEWLIVVRPFNANGQAGQSAEKLYITTMTQLPPRNPGTFVVQQVEGGLRRFAWMYAGERPAAFAGVQIRYLPGDVPLSVADWETMQPLGTADDVYTAHFVTTKPDAGQWTFGLRAVDTAGRLANGVLRFSVGLEKVFENIREPDLTPPPAPTGVTAVPLMTTAQVNWASPTYTVGHGHDHSVIYAAPWLLGGAAPAFSAAKSVGTEQGHPASIPVELGTKYTIWVTHVSVDGVESAPSAGVTFQTAQDVGKLLDVLEGKITESQLYTDLAKEIDLISGTGAGSVNARVLAEAQARAQAVAAEANTRAQAVASEAAARGQDVAAMAADLQAATDDLQARIDAVNAQVSDIIGASDFDPAQDYEAGQLVKYQNKLYRAKVNTVGNLPTNTTYWDLVGDYASLGEAVAAHAAQLADHANRITQTEQGLTAEASARTTLAAQLRGNYTGSDVAQVTSGLVWSERQARVSGDSANASAIDAVKARLPTGTGQLATAAALTAVDTKVTNIDGRVTSESSRLDQVQAAVGSAAAVLQALNPLGGESEWSAVSGPASATFVTAAESDARGGAVLTVGNATTNGERWLRHVATIPMDENKLYKLSARFRRTAGDGGIYLGIAGLNAAKTLYVNTSNVETSAIGSQHYATNNAKPALGTWQVVEYYFKGRAAGAATGSGTKASPRVFANKVAHLALMIVGNVQRQVGFFDLDYITLEDATADAANADATTALTSRVTTAEGNITSTSGALTTLTNRVTAAEGVNTSQATAISGLQSSVTSINGTLTSQGNSITSLSNSLDALQGAGDNLLKASNVELVRAAESYQMGGYTTTETLILGETYTLVACITHTPASGDVTSSVGAWVNGLKTINQNLVRNGSKVIATATFVFDDATAAGTLVNFYYYPSTIKTGAATVHWACLYQGAVVPPKAWQPSMAELGQALQTKADASALSSLQSTVSQQGDTITSQGSSLAALKNTVENPTTGLGSKASSSALTALDSKVTGIDGRLTSETSRIDSLQVSVSEAGGQNLLYNPSFDIGAATGIAGMADGYSRGGSAGVVATPSLPASWLDPLGKAQRYDCTGLTASLYADLFTANNLKPAVVEGQRAALSVYVRASAGLTVRVYLQAKADQTIGASLATYTGTLVTPGESGARLTLLTPALPAGTTALHVIFRFYGTATVSAGWVEWDRAQLELGTTVTAWRDNGVAGLSAVNAAVNTLATASANADAALASRATALESRMPTGTGQLATAAALTAVDTKVTNIDGRVTSESSRLDQVQAAVGSAAAGLQALNPLGGESEWSAVSGPASATFVTAAESDARGGAVLTVGNATTNGERWLRHVATIPMDENKLYKLSARFRRTAGDGGIYLGIAGLNAAKTLYVNTSNVETSDIGSQHYATNNAKPALGTWQVVEYYFKGRAAGAATGSGTKASPRVFANKVAHLALMIVGNVQRQVGFFDLDYITLEDVTADEQALAAIATEASTRATTDGYLGAQYSVRMQLSQGGQQVVGGFGISGTTSGTAGPQIDFGVMANSFWIAAPSGSPGGVSNVKPFVVQTTAQTVNGVSVPAGVYMDAAYINNVTALWARFGNLVADTIQATSISVTKLTGGNLSVGSWINSSNYVSGSTGWSINSNGQAEFSGVTVRGTIYSSAGTIGGITINGNGLNVGGFWGYVWPPAGQSGLHIGPNGILLGNANNGRYVEIQSGGNIYAPGLRIENGNATFSGNLSGASGTFSGILTAQRVISMENLDYNIATVAVGVTAGDQVSPINGEILGVTAPAADWSATYIVSFHAAVGAGTRGVLQIQVDGVTQFAFSLSEGGMKSFGFTFSGNGLARYVRLYVAGNNTAPVSSVIARSISVIVSKR